MAAAENLSPEHSEELTVYPPRSLGEAFRRYRRTAEWERKAKRTREDWWRAWKRSKPIFGDVNPRSVTLEDISAWRKTVEETVSLREAHRCLKIWRAMWKVAAALGYCIRDADPSLGVRNRAAPGRNLQWSEGEVVRVGKRAWRMGYHGLAAVIAVAWDTQLSPGDVRTLRASQLARGAAGEAFFTERGKTGKPVGCILSTRSLAVLSGSKGSASNCMVMRTSSAIGRARPTRPTRWATTSATCVPPSSGRLSVALLVTTSVAPARSKRSPVAPMPRHSHMPWATRSPPPTRCSRPMCRST
jgi:hypothetical protein